MKKLKSVCLVVFLLLMMTRPVHAQEKLNSFGQDFLEFWTDIKDNYAYFDKKKTDWNKVKEVYLPQAQQAKDSWALITVFEHVLEELYDHHISLNVNLQSSTRLVPSGLDVWAEWENGHAIIKEVRYGSGAELSGAKAGMEIMSINDIPVKEAIDARVGKCISVVDDEVRSFALRQLLAGNYLEKRMFVVKHEGNLLTINGEIKSAMNNKSILDFKITGRNIGYIKINNALGNNDLIKSFDSALVSLKDTEALIIDLRDTPGGGNSLVARGIMSRFIDHEMPYQKHELPDEEREFGIKRSWLEIVSPRGPFTYKNKAFILVNHWTGSMGEGLALGFDAMKRGIVIGTTMARLNGAMSGFKTSKANIPFSIVTEKLYHINGTPRERFVPEVLIDLTNRKYQNIQDPILEEALKLSF